MMIPIKTISEAKHELRKVQRGATGTDIYIAKCIPLLMELLEKSQRRRRGPAHPTEYNLFVAEHVKEGHSLQEVAKMWNKKKEMLTA